MKNVDDFVKKDESGLLQMDFVKKPLKFKDFIKAPDKLEDLKNKGKDKPLKKEKLSDFNQLNENVDIEKEEETQIKECNTSEKIEETVTSPSTTPILAEANVGGIVEPAGGTEGSGYNLKEAAGDEANLNPPIEEKPIDVPPEAPTADVPPEAPATDVPPEAPMGDVPPEAPMGDVPPEAPIGDATGEEIAGQVNVNAEQVVPEEEDPNYAETEIVDVKTREQIEVMMDELKQEILDLEQIEIDAMGSERHSNRPAHSASMRNTKSFDESANDNIDDNAPNLIMYEQFMNWNNDDLNNFMNEQRSMNEGETSEMKEGESEDDLIPTNNENLSVNESDDVIEGEPEATSDVETKEGDEEEFGSEGTQK